MTKVVKYNESGVELILGERKKEQEGWRLRGTKNGALPNAFCELSSTTLAA